MNKEIDIERIIKSRVQSERTPSINFAERIIGEANEIEQVSEPEYESLSFWDVVKSIFQVFNIKEPVYVLLLAILIGVILAFVLSQANHDYGYLRDFFHYKGVI